MRRTAICLALLSSLVPGANAWACGDKMVEIGRGVRYQRASAVRPASIVMFLSPGFDRQAANKLRSELVLVGHRVQMVDDAAALASILNAKHFDIVLTNVDNLALVTERVGATESKPVIIPLIDRSARDSAAEIQRRFPFVMLLSSRAFDQIALISRAMK
jgi:hypothetical protein